MEIEGREIKFYLRAGPFRKELAELLASFFGEYDADLHHRKDGKGSVISLNLYPDIDLDGLSKIFIDNQICRDKLDIFISIVTEYDSEIFDIPQYIGDAIKKIDPRITFSFTYINEKSDSG